MKTKSVQIMGFLLCLSLASISQARSMVYRHQNLADELVSFNTCSELEQHIKRSLLQDHSAIRPNDKDYFGGRKKGRAARSAIPSRDALGQSLSEAKMQAAAPSGMAKPSVEKEEAGPDDFTGTNNQVAKVDEADFVKFNGKHIFQLYQGQLKILKAWPANSMNLISSLAISGSPKELLMDDQTLVAISQQGSTTVASIIGIQNPSSPRLLTQFEIPGNYMSARLVGHMVRIVNQDYSSSLNYSVPQIEEPKVQGWFKVKGQPRTEIDNTPLNQIFKVRPTVQVLGGVRSDVNPMADCKRIYLPKTLRSGQLTRIVSLDLKGKTFVESMALISPSTIYASQSSLYLAQQGYSQDNKMRTSIQTTAIHRFDTPKSEAARYAATGMVNGHLINQFAMDEYKGNLRVATNGSEYTEPAWYKKNRGRWTTVNRVQVLKKRGNKLKVIGKTKNLAEGERLYSVRFNGDKGFLVTFRQVDPLFTLNLSNPRNPHAVGELKIPGFSTYIHILDDNHLLTIGKDADPKTGRAKGLKLSIFNTKNFKHPREVKSLLFAPQAASEAAYEHKAFSFYRSKGILAIPVTGRVTSGPSSGGWGSKVSVNGQRSSLLLFKVTTKDIIPSGDLDMTDMSDGGVASVRRSFFAENVVFAIGQNGVRAALIDRPESPLATVHYDKKLQASSW